MKSVRLIGAMNKTLMITTALVAATFALNAEHDGKKHGRPGSSMSGAKGMHGPGMMFEMMDADKDGKISKQEWQSHHERRFTELDADGDGNVTKEEMKAHHEKMKEKHGKPMCDDCGMKKHQKPGKKKKKSDEEPIVDEPQN